MKDILSNIWFKRVMSLFSAVYALGACFLCYCSLFYTVEISSPNSMCLLISVLSALFLVAMLYTRKQLITRISSFIIIPAMLPVVLFYFGEWKLIIPFLVTGMIIFLFSGAGEGVKTTLGTIILLFYIFGSLGYFLVTSFFITANKTETIESGVSPSGIYRYSVVNTTDSSNGSTAVYVEPNTADISLPKLFMTFRINNFDRIVYLERPLTKDIKVEWSEQTRQEITEQLNKISDHIVLHLSEKQLESLGYTYDEKLMLTDLSFEDYQFLGIEQNTRTEIYLDELDAQQLEHFNLARDGKGYYATSDDEEFLKSAHAKSGEKIYLKNLDSSLLSDLYIEKDDSVVLNQLTDEQLGMLGVAEKGDVMTFNGQICFRYYVAVLDDYFDTEHKKLEIF